MTIKSKIIADSTAGHGVRLTTMELTYPRIIHSEFMTHGKFSKNASSSRAIPVKKTLEAVIEHCAMPVRFGQNKPGMQDRGEEHQSPVIVPTLALDSSRHGEDRVNWKSCSPARAYAELAEIAMTYAEAFDKAGYHKQVINRILEPFSHITVTVSATDWVNFLVLRRDAAADPTMMALANSIYDTFKAAPSPKFLLPGEWHLPYVRDSEDPGYFMSNGKDGLEGVPPAAKMSAARCARTSYNNHDGSTPDADKDMALFESLLGGFIKHASPAEHPAMAMEDDHRRGKFRGFMPLRSFIPGEDFDVQYRTVDDYIAEQEAQP